MKRFFHLVVLLLLTGMLTNCGNHESALSAPIVTRPSGTNFLAWTGYDDASAAHSFKLARVNGKTGAVTYIGGTDYFPAIVYGPDGTLYGISDELRIINPQNGSTALIGSFQYLSTTVLMAGATFSPAGILYVMENASPHRVFTVHLTTAGLTSVGTPSALIRDLKFASNGTLYAAFADLFTLNPSDMSTLTTVGDMGKYIETLAFDNEGTLYGMDFAPSTRIDSVDLSTAVTTTFVQVGYTGLQSLVVEKSSALAAGMFSKSAGMNERSSPRSKETLLNLEKEITSARQTRRLKN